MRIRQVWVVEFKAKTGRKWFTTCDISDSKIKAGLMLIAARDRNPDDHYRVIRYTPAPLEHGFL
jgi:hypothetical protein